METSPDTITLRTYELFSIEWDRGSTWSGYHTYDEAARTLAGSSDAGRIVRKAWEVEIPADPRIAAIYLPGVSERTVEFEADDDAAHVRDRFPTAFDFEADDPFAGIPTVNYGKAGR